VDTTVVIIVVSMVLLSTATGLISPGTTSMVMSAVPPEEAGMASGTQSATRQLGGAIGVAVLGSVLATRYASGLTAKLTGGSASTYLPDARRSLAAALRATGAGNPVHAALVHASRVAFVDAMHVAALVAAGAAALCALFVFVALRAGPTAAPGRRARRPALDEPSGRSSPEPPVQAAEQP
jgi:hypothetical protein